MIGPFSARFLGLENGFLGSALGKTAIIWSDSLSRVRQYASNRELSHLCLGFREIFGGNPWDWYNSNGTIEGNVSIKGIKYGWQELHAIKTPKPLALNLVPTSKGFLDPVLLSRCIQLVHQPFPDHRPTRLVKKIDIYRIDIHVLGQDTIPY